MRLTTPQSNQLIAYAEQFHCKTVEVEPGTVLQTSNANTELTLVKSGWCGVLDHTRQFGSYTITRVEAPYLCGAFSGFDSNLQEEVVASSHCEIVLIGTLVLKPECRDFFYNILSSQVSPSEFPLLQKLIVEGMLTVPADQQSVSVFQRRWRPLVPSDLTKPSSVQLVYADRPAQGYRYGQVITSITLAELWTGALPRVLTWQDEPLRLDSSHDLNPSTSDTYALVSTKSATESQSDTSSTPLLGSSIGGSAIALESSDFIASDKELARKVRQLGYTPVTGRTQEKAFEAVFLMIIKYFSLPTRRDTIKKSANYLTDSRGGPSLDKLITVFDRFGLLGRVVSCRNNEFSRLPTPAIALTSSGSRPVLVVDSINEDLLCIDPAQGIKLYSLSDITSPDSSLVSVVSIVRGSSTPTSRFGLGWMLPYMSFYKYGLLEVFIASFITQLFALATPLLFQQIIDRVIGQGSSGALGGFAVLMALFMILELVFSSLRTFQFMEISNRIDINIGSSIISRLLRLNARFFEKRPVGELASRLNELDKIRSFLTGTALTVVLDALFALLYFGVMFFYSPLLSGIILGSIPLLLVVILGLTPITQKLIRQRAEAHSRTHSYMVEVLNGIQTVKLQNSELTARRNWENRHLDDINKGFKTVVANTASSNALQLINKSTNILVICVGASLVLSNDLTLGQLIAFRIISGYVTQPILRLASTWNNFQEVSMSVERLGDVVNQPLETSEIEATNIAMPPIKGQICFQEVSFGYSTNSKPQLAGVSLTIPAGSFTGLVGQSGCGKSTMLKLVPRLYEPTQGKVLIDGYDVSKVELYSLRRQLGFVPQDCLLFEGSIYNNIAVADTEAEADEVIEAAKMACAHDFIMSLPYGYNTPLGEKGSGLSGGQRQRVALARMLLQKPGLVILDEATSALDVDTEQQVVNNLRRKLQGTTVLMITHRLSTLIHADQIVMMHDGRLDSVGTHEQLMSKAGRYYALYQQQLVG